MIVAFKQVRSLDFLPNHCLVNKIGSLTILSLILSQWCQTHPMPRAGSEPWGPSQAGSTEQVAVEAEEGPVVKPVSVEVVEQVAEGQAPGLKILQQALPPPNSLTPKFPGPPIAPWCICLTSALSYL